MDLTQGHEEAFEGSAREWINVFEQSEGVMGSGERGKGCGIQHDNIPTPTL